MIVFPVLRTAPDIGGLLQLLHGRDRWRITREDWKKHARSDVLIGLRWRTAAGRTTSVMGLAPLGSTPPTRRAPYVALVAWTGSHANKHRPARRPDEVGLADMPVPDMMEAEAYEQAFKATRDKAKAMKSTLAEGAAEPHLAFCLPAELAPDLAYLRRSPG